MLSKARSSVSPHEGQNAKLKMGAMPRGQAHLDFTLYVLYVFGLSSLVQQNTPVEKFVCRRRSEQRPLRVSNTCRRGEILRATRKHSSFFSPKNRVVCFS